MIIKKSYFRVLGLSAFLLNAVIQVFYFIGFNYELFIAIGDLQLYDSFLLQGFAAMGFGGTRSSELYGLIVILSVAVLSVVFLVAFFMKKNVFFVIPAGLTILNIIFHLIFWAKSSGIEPLNYIGLLYKLAICAVYVLVLFTAQRMKYREKTKHTGEGSVVL